MTVIDGAMFVDVEGTVNRECSLWWWEGIEVIGGEVELDKMQRALTFYGVLASFYCTTTDLLTV